MEEETPNEKINPSVWPGGLWSIFSLIFFSFYMPAPVPLPPLLLNPPIPLLRGGKAKSTKSGIPS